MEEPKKRKTKTSWQVKERYNSKAYDRINLVVPKGQKKKLQEYAAKHGQSVSEFIRDCIYKAVPELDTVTNELKGDDAYE